MAMTLASGRARRFVHLAAPIPIIYHGTHAGHGT